MPDPSSPKPQKLLDPLRDAIRLKHYSYSTEKTYLHWVRCDILITTIFGANPLKIGG
jgi:hypothetical protein